MKTKQLEETKRAILADWLKAAHLNPRGFTDAWLDGALKMRGVFATARTFNEVRAYVRGELAIAEMTNRKSLTPRDYARKASSDVGSCR